MNKLRNYVGILGHRIADYDTQSGLTGKFMRWCWEFGYKHELNK